MSSKLTRRNFVRASAVALGAITVPAGFAEKGTESNSTQTFPAAVKADLECVGEPVPVSISIAAGQPIRTMRGGLGASFHAISRPLPSTKPGGDSWSGSGWGGNPDADDDAHWKEIFHHADWLGLNWCRVEIEQQMYEPEKRQFTWDTPEMRVLYRILDWAEHRGVDVFLQQMWADVAWNAYPGNAEDPVRRLRSAPYSLAEWAYGFGELMEHLVKARGYTCIRWVSIVNEPGHEDFSWWQDSEMKPVPLTPGLAAARAELDRRGINVPLSGPDWTDLPELNDSNLDFDPYIGAYDLHSYSAVFHGMSGGYTLEVAERRMKDWAEWAHAKGKPFFLSEFGTMAYGWGHVDGSPACYASGLKNASLIVRGINAGVDGFNRWSFTNRGDLDGQWQLIRTWDVARNRLMDKFTPQPNAYYQYAILTRFAEKHSGVLATTIEGPWVLGDRRVVATALQSPKGNLTVLVVNESYQATDVTIHLDGWSKPADLYRYAVTQEMENKCNVELAPQSMPQAAGGIQDTIPPLSIVAYSTYRRSAKDLSVMAD